MQQQALPLPPSDDELKRAYELCSDRMRSRMSFDDALENITVHRCLIAMVGWLRVKEERGHGHN